MKNKTLHIAGLDIILDGEGSGELRGTLKEKCPYCSKVDCYRDCDECWKDYSLENEADTRERRDYNCSMDGIESLLLAMACEGIDLEDKRFEKALQTAIESAANNV